MNLKFELGKYMHSSRWPLFHWGFLSSVYVINATESTFIFFGPQQVTANLIPDNPGPGSSLTRSNDLPYLPALTYSRDFIHPLSFILF